MTRLLKTAMNGTTTATVASSWIDGLGGLLNCCAFRMPPAFCAAAPPSGTAAIRDAASKDGTKRALIR